MRIYPKAWVPRSSLEWVGTDSVFGVAIADFVSLETRKLRHCDDSHVGKSEFLLLSEQVVVFLRLWQKFN